MPTYEYRCTRCDHGFECFQRVGDPAPACPQCGGATRKVYSSVGLIFKGKGFHTTDYRKPAPADGEAKPATPPAAKDATTPSSSKDTAAPASAKGAATTPPSPPGESPKGS